MAIYHLSAKVIKRSKGQSAVACAAYRAGGVLHDERTGERYDYTRKSGIDDSYILAPENAPAWVYDRNELWNAVEKSEKRKDAQLAREIDIALPIELNRQQQKDLVDRFVKKHFVDKGMVADIAYHKLDSHNPHIHVMLTTRNVGVGGFGSKNREWNRKELLQEWREAWEEEANRALEQAKSDSRISHKTLKAQGIDRLPTVHVGVSAMAIENKGNPSERGTVNKAIMLLNAKLHNLKEAKEEVQKQLVEETNKNKRDEAGIRFFEIKEEYDEILRSLGYGRKNLSEIDDVIDMLERRLNDEEKVESEAMKLIEEDCPMLALEDGNSISIFAAHKRWEVLEKDERAYKASIEKYHKEKPVEPKGMAAWFESASVKEDRKRVIEWYNEMIAHHERKLKETQTESKTLREWIDGVADKYLDRVKNGIKKAIGALKGLKDKLTLDVIEYCRGYEEREQRRSQEFREFSNRFAAMSKPKEEVKPEVVKPKEVKAVPVKPIEPEKPQVPLKQVQMEFAVKVKKLPEAERLDLAMQMATELGAINGLPAEQQAEEIRKYMLDKIAYVDNRLKEHSYTREQEQDSRDMGGMVM